jgi:hypothetical protein
MIVFSGLIEPLVLSMEVSIERLNDLWCAITTFSFKPVTALL